LSKVDKKSIFEAKRRTRCLIFKGRACKLDFPALHVSNFAAKFTGCQFLGPEKSVKVVF